MTALVTARGLRIAGRLEETSLDLCAGELVALVGPNGSGKTSLLHALAGISGAAGEVRIGGMVPRRLGPDQRQRLFTFLPASRDVKWPLGAADLIALGLPGGADPAVIESLVATLEIENLLERRVDRLSTGERSRILIARALAAQPRLLLLDEAVANLDPLWQLKLMDHLRALTRTEGTSVLLAIHDLDMACAYADRLLVMDEGRVAGDGDPKTLLGGPLIPAIFGIERLEGAWRPVA